MLPHLPTFRRRIVCHVGTLFVSRSGIGPAEREESSQEGPGLSVSVHPQAWTAIAKLGGQDTYALKRIDGRPGVFVDMLAIKRPLREKLTKMLIAQGLITLEPKWEVIWSEETNWDEFEDVSSTFDTEEQARAEASAIGRDARVEPIIIPVETPLLLRYWKRYFRSPHSWDAFDLGLNLLVNLDKRYDGLWWHEILDVDNLSAPRGVIVPDHIRAWSAAVDMSCGDDVEW